MYSSEKNSGINWKDLIIKAIFLVVFLLLLVWLFPDVPNMKPFYSNVFRENIKYMQDAAESYYTTDKLPKNIGDTAEMTLGEMINKNLILPFVDENGEECDKAESYVQITKNKNDYTLKVNLVCPNEKNFVKKTLGCYEYCETCKEQLEYQFSKPTEQTKTSYSCPDGGSLSNGMCNVYTTDTYKATETSKKGSEYCPDGGRLDNGYCYVSSERSYKASTSSGSYYCPYGGRVSGSTCYVDNSTSYAPTIDYSCPNGGRVSGSTCIATTAGSSYAASIKNYTCPNGTVQNSISCKTTTAGSSYTATATTTSTKVKYTYPVSGSAYTSLGTTTEYICTSSANCPGYVTYYNYLKKTTKYSCPNGGTLDRTTCRISGTTTTKNGTANYYCPNGGNLNGKTCVVSGITNNYAATINKTCPNGGSLNNGTCYINNTQTYAAYRDSGYEYCPNGGTLRNGKCYVDNSYHYKASVSKGESVYTCPNGGNLDGKECKVYKLVKSYAPKATVSKVTVKEYKWSTEKTLEGWTPTGETRAVSL